MVKTGIVSATFRHLSAEKVLKLVSETGLEGIEWSSDIHIPPGNKCQATLINKMCHNFGIEVCGYASYYRLGEHIEPLSAFHPILETASELGAPVIRIWAGGSPSSHLSEKQRRQMEQEARLLVKAASNINAVISFEYHPNTLTDTKESALGLLNAVPGSKVHWQACPSLGEAENIAAIRLLAPCITTIHVQEYRNQMYCPLSDGSPAWSSYFKEIKKLPGCHFACLEFVRNGSVSQFMADAKELSRLIKKSEYEEETICIM